ncbi:MAG TPA: nicotinamide riboside transporter PnuC [Gemmatimonadaceae bacterium]|nr:nicotinamide riboside transporter PnuC [Gemmatimonadaceae bacterium]
MTGPWEVAANVMNATATLLAGRNSIHTWWTGIVAGLLFGVVFFGARLYADVALQCYFIASCAVGWWRWQRGDRGAELPVRRCRPTVFGAVVAAGVAAAAASGWVLGRFTDAYAPFLDSVILTFSVLGQLLLVDRRYESWWLWLVVNTIAVPVYASRGLYLTAVLYAAFWVNAVVALVRWRRLLITA